MQNPPPSPAAGIHDFTREFDVRPLPGRVKHTMIFQRWLALQVGDHFVLLNDHDPKPLYYQFSAEFPGAFAWEYLQRGPEEFRVKITKTQSIAADSPVPNAPCGCGNHAATHAPSAAHGDVVEVDARGLPPPEPLVRILAQLEQLTGVQRLHARTDREPCHLFGEAASRGFRHTCSVQPDGSWVTVLTRA